MALSVSFAGNTWNGKLAVNSSTGYFQVNTAINTTSGLKVGNTTVVDESGQLDASQIASGTLNLERVPTIINSAVIIEQYFGSHGQSVSTNTWKTTTLNTVQFNNISGVTLNNNTVTISNPGTYCFEAAKNFWRPNAVTIRLLDTTTGTFYYGMTAHGDDTGGSIQMQLYCTVTITSSTSFQLQYYINGNRGYTFGFTGPSLMTIMRIIKIH